MFEDYTSKQLIALRQLCTAVAEQGSTIAQAADALLLLEHIDRELAVREQRKTA